MKPIEKVLQRAVESADTLAGGTVKELYVSYALYSKLQFSAREFGVSFRGMILQLGSRKVRIRKLTHTDVIATTDTGTAVHLNLKENKTP